MLVTVIKTTYFMIQWGFARFRNEIQNVIL